MLTPGQVAYVCRATITIQQASKLAQQIITVQVVLESKQGRSNAQAISRSKFIIQLSNLHNIQYIGKSEASISSWI
jgi:hypothetical protein